MMGMVTHPFLEGNLKALETQHAPIFHWLAVQGLRPQDLDGNLITNQWGLLDWRLPSGKGLFDCLSPKLAYRDWTPTDRADTSATLIVGCNLGYGVNHVLSNTPNSHKVLVLEPRPEMLLACLSQTDYRPFFRAKKLFFVPPDLEFLRRVVWQLDLQYVFGNIFVLSDIPSHQLGPEYAIWTHHWRVILENITCDINTLRRKQDVMVNNELNNFARAIQDGSLLPLKNQGRGLSAVVLGAGPSLAEFAPLLAKSPSNDLYACGLQTLPVLQEYGLRPHLCMAIDYTMAMKKVCDGLDMKWAQDIPLIYSHKVAPEAVRAYPGPTMPVWTDGGLGTCMPGDRELVLKAGGNVAVALTRFLTWCGMDQILLVGHDFAWPGEKTHVAGHLSEKNRFRFDPKRHTKIRNRQGKTIYSDLAYITALRELEKDLKQSDMPVFNLYGGGAIIQGSKEVTWSQVLAEELLVSTPGSLEHFLSTMNRARSPRPWPVFEARSPQWTSSLRSVQKRLEKLFKKASRHQEEIHAVLNQILFFLRQDPLYQPYLYNEIFSLAGLINTRSSYGLKEMAACRGILKRVAKKVWEVDYHLIYNRKAA
jgi:hypothetical protein